MLFLTMTLAGTAPVLAFLFLKIFAGSRLPAKYYVWLLRLGVVFYLLPFQRLKNWLHWDILYPYSNTPWKWSRILSRALFGRETINIPDLQVGYYYVPKIFLYLCIPCILLSAALLVYRFHSLPGMKKRLTKDAFLLPEKSVCFTPSDKISRFYTKKNIRIYISDQVSNPCTAGILHPYILIPPARYTPEETGWLLRHETTHILHRDALWKCLSVLCCVLHWYNPFAYCLLLSYNTFCEYYCDEECMRDRPEEEKKGYAAFLVASAEKTHTTWKPTLNLSDGGKKMFTRLQWLFQKESAKPAILILILTCTCFLSSLSIYAYQPDYGKDPLPENTYFVYEWEDDYYDEHDLMDFSKSDTLFISDDGTVTPIYNNEDIASARAKCNHNYVSGKIEKHTLLKNGGCEVLEYTCKRCNKCKQTINEKKAGTHSYTKCPHKTKK